MFWRNIHLVRVNFSFYHTAVEIMEISWKRRFYYRVDFTKYYGGRISCFSTRWKLRKHRNHSVVISMKFRNFSYQPLWKKSPWNRLFNFHYLEWISRFHGIYSSVFFPYNFDKNFVKVTVLLKKLLKSSFHEKISVILSLIFAKSFQTFRPVDLIHTTRSRRG